MPEVTTLVPTGTGDENGIISQSPSSGSHWDKVDDGPTHDGADTRIYQFSVTPYRDLYLLGDLPADAGTIESITVNVVVKKGGGTCYSWTSIKTGGTVVDGDQVSPTTAWLVYSTVYTTNPVTGLPWTVDDINSLQAGVKLRGADAYSVTCTAVYVDVTWNHRVNGGAGIGSPFIF